MFAWAGTSVWAHLYGQAGVLETAESCSALRAAPMGDAEG